MKAPRFRIRIILLAVALLAILLAWVLVPAWNYYRLPPSTRSILERLGRPFRLATPAPPNLVDLLKSARLSSPDSGGVGIPIYVDPAGLEAAGADIDATIKPPPAGASVATALEESLRPLGLGYYVEDGLLKVTSSEAADRALREKPREARRP
jgi:hypothetical protein